MEHSTRLPSKLRSAYGRTCVTVCTAFLCVCILVHHAARIPSEEAEYVALGSSFAAGPGDGQQAAGSYVPCMRSGQNYAHLFAKRVGLRLKDVTCSGATTADVLEGGQFFQPSQIDAVTKTTKLVTVTVGGNDVFYLSKLGAWACANDPAHVPLAARWIGVCRSSPDEKMEQAFADLPAQMIEVVEQVHRRASAAHVIFVDYTNVLPDQGTCEQLDLSTREAENGRRIAGRLATVTAEAARKTNSGLIQASEITRGHDVCSAQPWVFGFQFPKHALTFGPAPFHPRTAAMQRIADELTSEYTASSMPRDTAARWDGDLFVRREGDHLSLDSKP